jgi:drug/metabolite transporter superfamily protein YnfA
LASASPDRWDIIGAAFSLVGAAIILWGRVSPEHENGV